MAWDIARCMLYVMYIQVGYNIKHKLVWYTIDGLAVVSLIWPPPIM